MLTHRRFNDECKLRVVDAREKLERLENHERFIQNASEFGLDPKWINKVIKLPKGFDLQVVGMTERGKPFSIEWTTRR